MSAANRNYRTRSEQGVSLTGLIFILVILGGLLLLGFQITPAVVEFQAIKRAIAQAKQAGGTPREMRASFDKAASATYIESIKGSDLAIDHDNGDPEISFQYEKKIPLIANASLLLNFEGTTAKGGVVPKAAEATK